MAAKRMDEATRKRVRAGRLLQKGKRPAEIALDVGVARQTLYAWKAIFDEGGIDALRADVYKRQGVHLVALAAPQVTFGLQKPISGVRRVI